jgi:hypothetical protein
LPPFELLLLLLLLLRHANRDCAASNIPSVSPSAHTRASTGALVHLPRM